MRRRNFDRLVAFFFTICALAIAHAQQNDDTLPYCTSCEVAMIEMGLKTLPCKLEDSESGSGEYCGSGTGSGTGPGTGSG